MAPEKLGHLVFTCGSRHFGLPAGLASEVVSLPSLTAVPGAPPHVLGVFSLRGELLPVVDLGLLGGGEPLAARRAVVARLPGGSVALVSTRVPGVLTLETDGAERRGPDGLAACLLGPASCAVGEVWVLEVAAFFDLLAGAGAPRT